MSRRFLLGVVSFIAVLPLSAGETAPKKEAPPRYDTRPEHDPAGTGRFYMGREIAQVMSHLGAGWLDRPEREKEEQTSKLLPALKIKAGDAVVDLGAGSGYYTFPLAKIVGPQGKVYAVDIQQEMLDLIGQRMKKSDVKNIDLVRGTENDPKLPPASVDLIFLVDVYHEFSQPYEMTAAMVKALKPGGRLVFVEFRKEDPAVPILEVHKMTKAQVIREMEPFPLRHVETLTQFPWQHVIIFEKRGG